MEVFRRGGYILIKSRVCYALSCRLSSSETKSVGAKDESVSRGETVDTDEVQRHSKLADIWWNELGEMKGLHSMNKLRVQLVRDGLANTGKTDPKLIDTPEPLCGVKILEVGCGGGIFTEPLARIGATVTGVDASRDLIQTARMHACQDRCLESRLEYINDTIENHALSNKECYDAVVASEVLEHVSQKDLFISALTATLKPGGSVFITTLNKTFPAWAGGIIAAEYVLRLLPIGTHDWNKFISPNETQCLLEKYNCSTVLVHGMLYNFVANEWHWISNKSINYALHAVKKPLDCKA